MTKSHRFRMNTTCVEYMLYVVFTRYTIACTPFGANTNTNNRNNTGGAMKWTLIRWFHAEFYLCNWTHARANANGSFPILSMLITKRRLTCSQSKIIHSGCDFSVVFFLGILCTHTLLLCESALNRNLSLHNRRPMFCACSCACAEPSTLIHISTHPRCNGRHRKRNAG